MCILYATIEHFSNRYTGKKRNNLREAIQTFNTQAYITAAHIIYFSIHTHTKETASIHPREGSHPFVKLIRICVDMLGKSANTSVSLPERGKVSLMKISECVQVDLKDADTVYTYSDTIKSVIQETGAFHNELKYTYVNASRVLEFSLHQLPESLVSSFINS